MWARSLIVIAVLAGPAAAEFDASPDRDIEPVVQTPRIRIGHPGDKLAIDKMAVTIQQDALGTTAHVTLMVTTTDTAAREAGSGEDRADDQLPELSALAIDASAKTIEIVNGGSTIMHRKVKRAITIDVPRQRVLTAVPLTAARPHVSAATSFYVGFPLSMDVPTITFGRAHPRRLGPYSVDKQEIRREIKRHIARLGRCYERVVEYKGGIEGEAVLHFEIDRAGKVASTTIDGTIEDREITSCLEGVVAQFEFRPGDGNVVVNYPLRFHLAGS